MNSTRPSRRPTAYDAALALLGGSSLGWFAWWFTGAYVVSDGTGGSGIPLWVFEVLGVAAVFFLLMRVRSRSEDAQRRSRWVHLLWIPVILFVLLMIQVVLTLRNCC